MATIRFTVVKRTVKIKGVDTEIYYPILVSDGKLDTKELSKKGAMAGTLSTVEFTKYARGIVDIMKRDIVFGRGVRLDALGTFKPFIRSRFVTEEKDCTATTIVKKGISFTMSEELKTNIKNNVSFRKADNIDKGD